jgi:hypothetical protein
VERLMISAVLGANWPTDFAPASRPIHSVVPGTARPVLDPVLETAALRMDTVEALLLTVVRDGKFTYGVPSISWLTFFLQPKGCFKRLSHQGHSFPRQHLR